ncbi:hypothetical protein LY78DRAFT_144246 [Colletotrichum sublineola]|uniref:Uncharacterized protein n=1 Tax=Colletotrichum sublineola TaxID=1173701 RepID=A0A066Y0C5_COLSU|nr:hypothetical protein LY78DRAFT_144246 [Colletotrichum sublineola]KDN71501.1 hypothetical protein CSUB01_07594 [Colletotrichum sublineola]
MPQPTASPPPSEDKDVSEPVTQLSTTKPAKDQPTPGLSAHGISTVNVLITAISRGKPPADPQTRSDFCFDRLLSFLPHDENKLLRVYDALGVPSAILRRWASKGRKRLGKNVVKRLEKRQDTAPGEYQFALDHLYVWGIANVHDDWARAGREYHRKLKRERERERLPVKKKAAKQTDVSGTVANEASSSQPKDTSASSRKRNRNAADNATNVRGAHSRHAKFKNKKAAGIGPSPLGKFSSSIHHGSSAKKQKLRATRE